MVAGTSGLNKVTVSCCVTVSQKVYSGWYFLYLLVAIQTTMK